jgi:hypothetical protein
MSVASPPVSVEKLRNRIDASSRTTVFEVVHGNDKLLDTLGFSDSGDMRSSRNRTFAFTTSAAAASGQTRKDSRGEADGDIPSSALGCPSGALVSCSEFMDPARFYEQVSARVDVPFHTPRIGVRKTSPREFRRTRRIRRIAAADWSWNNGSPTRFRIRAIKRLRSVPQSMGTIPLRQRGSGPAFPEKPAVAPGAHARASPSFAIAHPSSPNGTRRTSAIPSLR